jgi:hypothetical protein
MSEACTIEGFAPLIDTVGVNDAAATPETVEKLTSSSLPQQRKSV